MARQMPQTRLIVRPARREVDASNGTHCASSFSSIPRFAVSRNVCFALPPLPPKLQQKPLVGISLRTTITRGPCSGSLSSPQLSTRIPTAMCIFSCHEWLGVPPRGWHNGTLLRVPVHPSTYLRPANRRVSSTNAGRHRRISRYICITLQQYKRTSW